MTSAKICVTYDKVQLNGAIGENPPRRLTANLLLNKYSGRAKVKYRFWEADRSDLNHLLVGGRFEITIIFESNLPDEDPLTFWAFYNITAQKSDLETTIHLGKPKNIAEIISYLLKQRKELFTKGQPHILDTAWDLLMEMGYSNFNPVWVGEW